jgi:cytochrome P450
MEICEDCESVSMKMVNVMFPQLIDYNLGTENRRITRNNNEIGRVLKKFLQENEDKTSVYCQVVDQIKNKDQVFQDCISMLVGGHETTFLIFSSALYCLKKYPECYENLMAEIHEKLLENGKYTSKDIAELINPEKLDELEYLSFFLKEVIRMHPPAVRSLGYIAKRSFKLSDIMIPKGEVLAFNIYASHFNRDQWIDPLAFKPERFDPSSEWFKTPSGNKRRPFAYIPFTFGGRTCPGRSLGKFGFGKFCSCC